MFPLSDSIKSGRFAFVNILLLAVTVFVFIQQVTAPDREAFTTSFALIPALIDLTNYNTWYPFVTAMFLHGNLLHILSNMWFLWVFGDNVEGRFGPFFYPLLYLITGIAGNVVQYLLAPDSDIPILGASGAVAGVLGAYFILFPHAKIKTLVPFFGFLTILSIPATFMLGYWIVLQLISGAASFSDIGTSGGVAFFAHIGGFVSGLILAKLFGGNAQKQIQEGRVLHE